MAATLKTERFQDLAGSDLAEQLLAKAPKWISLLLFVLILWKLQGVIFAFFQSPDVGADESGPASGTPARTAQNSAEALPIAEITNAHLFGITDAKDEIVDAPIIENVVATDLNIKLKGTIAADDPQYAMAIIADNSSKEKVYSVKDVVASGVTLHAVERERVILNQSGRLTSLDLPKEFKNTGSAISSNRSSSARTASSSPSPQTDSVRDTLTQNASKLTDVIRPQPYFSGGKQKGYRIYPGKDRRQFAALGLRPGDLVTEINGTPMTDPRQGMEVFRSLGDATSVTVTVERNGQPQTLTLSTSQIGSSQ